MLPSLRTSRHGPSESASNVEQLAVLSNTDGSTEQLAALHNTSRFQTLADLRHWMDSLSENQRREEPVRRVRQALLVLELGASRDARTQLQALLKSWGIKQKDSSNKKNSFSEVHQCVVAEVLAEGNKLRALRHISLQASFRSLFRSSAEQPVARLDGRSRSRSRGSEAKQK